MAIRASLSRGFFHPGDGADGFHKGKSLRVRGGGAFAIEVHQVRRDGLRTVLAQHCGDLAAVIGTVISEMLQRLPEGIRVDSKIDRLVFEHAVEFRLRQAVDEVE